jgi:proline dehydrogenase
MIARAALLAASRSQFLRTFMAAKGLQLGARRFVAGETLDDFVEIVRELNRGGFLVASAILGEQVASEGETHRTTAEYKQLLSRIASEGLKANVALKLTHLGLGISESLASENLAEIVAHAARLTTSIRVDMEDSARVDATLRIYRAMRKAGHDNVGAVLQAYLYRTPADLEALGDCKPNLRLVKGAYLEPPSVAYAKKPDVDAAFKRLIEHALLAGGYTAIATHDEDAIRHASSFIRAKVIPNDRFEFQMLYGVRPALQKHVRDQGYTVRIAAPFGREWYPYFMRRLAERPANVAFVLRSFLKG